MKNSEFTKKMIGNRIIIKLNGVIIARPMVLFASQESITITTSLNKTQLDRLLSDSGFDQQIDSAEAATND